VPPARGGGGGGGGHGGRDRGGCRGRGGAAVVTGDLRLLSAFLALSKATLRVIRQNLFWAFSYNLVAIPPAALGYLNPVLAGAAMALSSVSVLSNALLLKRGRLNRF